METSLMVNDYPEPTFEEEHTLRLKLYVETSVVVYGDRDTWYEQLNEMKDYELLENVNEVEIEEYEKI